jgi:hypothetical protein
VQCALWRLGGDVQPVPTLVDLAARALALAGVTVAECHDAGYPTPLRDAVVRACCKALLPVRTNPKTRRKAYDQADRDIERDRLLEQRPAMLRKKPKQGKQYANTAAFNADLEEWKKERDERKVLVALNARNLAKLRVFPTPLKPRPRKPQEQLFLYKASPTSRQDHPVAKDEWCRDRIGRLPRQFDPQSRPIRTLERPRY